MSASTIKLDKEIAAVIKRLERARTSVFTQEFQEAIDDGAKIVVQAAKANAPESDEPHSRYSTAKVNSGSRAPKGLGNVIATYFPGNLRRSIRVLKKYSGRLSRTIGPWVMRRTPYGDVKGRRVDAYYAHMVHDGTTTQAANPYMEKAASQVGGSVKKKLVNAARSVIKKGFGR